MGFVLRLLFMLAVALGLGFGLSWFALTDGRWFAATQSGPWAAWPAAGQPAPDPYTRAHLARTGHLQLGHAEGIQFVATTDSAGNPLERRCAYRVAGTMPGATFWTLVATTPAGENVAASREALAVHSDRIAWGSDGMATIHVSPMLAPGNWLEIAGEGPFRMALTFYDSTLFAGAGGAGGTVAMPAITRGECA